MALQNYFIICCKGVGIDGLDSPIFFLSRNRRNAPTVSLSLINVTLGIACCIIAGSSYLQGSWPLQRNPGGSCSCHITAVTKACQVLCTYLFPEVSPLSTLQKRISASVYRLPVWSHQCLALPLQRNEPANSISGTCGTGRRVGREHIITMLVLHVKALRSRSSCSTRNQS